MISWIQSHTHTSTGHRCSAQQNVFLVEVVLITACESLTMWPCFPLCLLPSSVFVCLLFLPAGHLCPAVCSCMDYHTIDCRDQGLPSVPNPFPLDVRKLLIADNNIQAIPADFFIFYGDLVYLDFRNSSEVFRPSSLTHPGFWAELRAHLAVKEQTSVCIPKPQHNPRAQLQH